VGSLLVTGAAGFIGYHLCEALLARGCRVIGADSLNEYYDVGLKEARLARLEAHAGFEATRIDLADRRATEALFSAHRLAGVVHLAAQPGVRHSLTHPHDYVDSNLVAFLHVLEGCRHADVDHLVYASSSSVYGANRDLPYAVGDPVDHPVSLYAATKKANELMAHTYSHLYGLPTTGLRFFTVYGPWGRPDMAYFLFTRAILEGRPIDVFNHGRMRRDFTYVDDVVDGVLRVLDRVPETSYDLFNIGHNQPVELLRFIEVLEEALGRRADRRLLPMQPGDVEATYADIEPLRAAVGFSPSTPIEEGLPRFVAWYRDHYRV